MYPVSSGRILIRFFPVLFVSCLSISPRIPAEAYIRIGDLYLKEKQPDRAIEYYLKAEKLTPGLPAGAYGAARGYLAAKQPHKALPLLLNLLKKDPKNLLVRETLAYAYTETGELKQAEKMYRELQKEVPGEVRFLFNLGMLELKKSSGKTDPSGEPEAERVKARAYFEAVYKKDPHMKRNLAELSKIYREQGQKKKSREFFILSLKEADPSPEELQSFTDRLIQEKAYSEALTILDFLGAPEREGKETFKAKVFFLKGTLLTAYMKNFNRGYAALRESVERGFQDREAVKKLLRLPGIPSKEILEKYFKTKNLL